jgi:hypothetical protein
MPPWPGPPRRSGGGRVVLLVALVVLGLLAAIGAAGAGVAFWESRSAAQTRAAVVAELPGLQRLVETERGLPFLRPVRVEVLDDEEFAARFEAPLPGEENEPEPGDPASTLLALGLADSDLLHDDGADDTVVGFYEPGRDAIVLRGSSYTPYSRTVLVHELVHALQDQHFDIDRPELLGSPDERDLAFTALIEGDAMVVENAVRAALPERLARAVDADEKRLFGAVAPSEATGLDTSDPLVALDYFPYDVGPALVSHLLDVGGQEALDAAFARPPTTTEQVLVPERYVQQSGATTLSRPSEPALDGWSTVADEGVLGALGLRLLLVGADDDLAVEAVDGWAGDRYVTVRGKRESCTRVDVLLDDTEARELLAEALEVEWVPETDAVVRPTGDRGLRLDSCASHR